MDDLRILPVTGNLGKGHEPVTRAERKLYQ